MADTSKKTSNMMTIGSLLIAVIACSLLIDSMPLHALLNQGQLLKSWLASAGYAAPALFVFATAALTAIGLPRLIFCTLAGVVFGFAWGFVWSHLGTLLGSYGTFIFSRWCGREYIQQKFPKISALTHSAQGRGWRYVLLMRQMPINGLYNDILLGMSAVSQRDFWIGSILGFLPLGVTATLTGAGAIQGDISLVAQDIGVAAGAFFLLTLSLKWALTRRRSKKLSIS